VYTILESIQTISSKSLDIASKTALVGLVMAIAMMLLPKSKDTSHSSSEAGDNKK
jgi:hypothetical protein